MQTDQESEGQSVERRLASWPAMARIVGRLLHVWPEHRTYIEARYRDMEPAFEDRTEELAELALVSIGDEMDRYVSDYRWMCEAFLDEEIHFRRHGGYRLSTFEEAYEQVYSDPAIMDRYVRGILISQIVWMPHAQAFDTFRREFVDRADAGSRYLEVGPGHGFFLYFASRKPDIATLEAWDVSKSSIEETKKSLAALGAQREITITRQDILEAPARPESFDMAVISEVLEHLERPEIALKTLLASLRPGGRIFINAPVNSPAPDHIYLWRDTEEFEKFVTDQGFEIEQAWHFPVTGASLDRAKKKQLSISCVLIARKPA